MNFKTFFYLRISKVTSLFSILATNEAETFEILKNNDPQLKNVIVNTKAFILRFSFYFVIQLSNCLWFKTKTVKMKQYSIYIMILWTKA